MLTKEDGPFSVFLRFRTRYPLGGLMTCIYCLSVWAAAFFLFLWFHPEWPWTYPLLLLFAASGLALGWGTYTGANLRD